MCWRCNCPFRTKYQHKESTQIDDVSNLLIFGITGMIGGAVLDATLGCAWLKVSGFTRSRSGQAYDELKSKGVRMFTGDMNKLQTIRTAMKDVDIVFLVTNYWESRSVETEYNQGVNVVNVAIENSVKHLIYVGTDYSIIESSDKCTYLEGKVLVENYIVSVGIPFTILHVAFFFENLLSVFKPHCVGSMSYAIALPMDETPLNWGSVSDIGYCIGRLALEPDGYMFKTVKLATAYLTVTDMARYLDGHFPNAVFYNPKITLKDYGQLHLEEAKELVTMFAHYHKVPEWDRTDTYNLNPFWRSVDQWIRDSDKNLLNVLLGETYSAHGKSDSRLLANARQIQNLTFKMKYLLPLLGGISNQPSERSSMDVAPKSESNLAFLKSKIPLLAKKRQAMKHKS